MTSQSTKDPNKESQNPAPMPKSQQGQGRAGGPDRPADPQGRQGGHHAKMAVHSDSPPGIELDGKARIIPLDERTEGDRQKALRRDK